MKRLVISILIPFLFLSCWIEPNLNDYEYSNGIWYFDDYETMRSTMVAEINETFKDWHWSNDKFNQKYSYYKNNTILDSELYDNLLSSGHNYLVKYGVSNNTVQYYTDRHELKYIRDNYFLFIENNGDTLVLFQN